jgi:hypothetical protein
MSKFLIVVLSFLVVPLYAAAPPEPEGMSRAHVTHGATVQQREWSPALNAHIGIGFVILGTTGAYALYTSGGDTTNSMVTQPSCPNPTLLVKALWTTSVLVVIQGGIFLYKGIRKSQKFRNDVVGAFRWMFKKAIRG